MTRIQVFQNHKQQYVAFSCLGHSGYAEAGTDIVCAGISALVINTINALEALTTEEFDTEQDADTGLIKVTFRSPAEHDAKLLIDAMILGLQGIRNNYGNDYITLDIKEV